MKPVIDIHTVGHWPTEMLIKMIQKTHLSYVSKVDKGQVNVKEQAQVLSELGQMRLVVQEKLKKVDRTKPDFFPVGALVVYRDAYNEFESTVTKEGTVVGYKNQFVQVKFSDEEFQTQVDPKNLTLLFIRHQY